MELNLTGLTAEEAKQMQNTYGKNEINASASGRLPHRILLFFEVPVIFLLLLAVFLWFLLGDPMNAVILLALTVLVAVIVGREDRRMKDGAPFLDFEADSVSVLRDGEQTTVSVTELLPGDIVFLKTGESVPADGVILKADCFYVDESSFVSGKKRVQKTVFPDRTKRKMDLETDHCYAGTMVIEGNATLQICKIGLQTKLGKAVSKQSAKKLIRLAVSQPIIQIICLISAIGILLFGAVFSVYCQGFPEIRWEFCLLAAITVAIAVIPWWIPLAFHLFSPIRTPKNMVSDSGSQTVPHESSSSVPVLCVDIDRLPTEQFIRIQQLIVNNEKELFQIARYTCAKPSIHPIEDAIATYPVRISDCSAILLKKYEKPQLTGYLYAIRNRKLLVLRGEPTAVLNACQMEQSRCRQLLLEAGKMQKQGQTVIAFAKSVIPYDAPNPDSIDDVSFHFCGVIGLTHPLLQTLQESFCQGERIFFLSEQNRESAAKLRRAIGFPLPGHRPISGSRLQQISDAELDRILRVSCAFDQLRTQDKKRILQLLANRGEQVTTMENKSGKLEIVAMDKDQTPSNGKKEAISVNPISHFYLSRRLQEVYKEYQRRIPYLLSMQIPIIIGALLPCILKISPEDAYFFPTQILLLQFLVLFAISVLSVPVPTKFVRFFSESKFDVHHFRNIFTGILTGGILSVSSSVCYLTGLHYGTFVENSRSMGMFLLIFSNFLLLQLTRYPILDVKRTFRNILIDKPLLKFQIFTLTVLIVLFLTPCGILFSFASLSGIQIFLCLLLSFISVFWFALQQNNLFKRKNCNRSMKSIQR